MSFKLLFINATLSTLKLEVKSKVVLVLNLLSTMPRRMGDWRYSSTIRELGTRWRYLVNFTPRPRYPHRNHPQYQLYRRLGGPQSWSGCWSRQKSLTPARNRTPGVQPIACHYTGSLELRGGTVNSIFNA
jgi:hypothetical protein